MGTGNTFYLQTPNTVIPNALQWMGPSGQITSTWPLEILWRWCFLILATQLAMGISKTEISKEEKDFRTNQEEATEHARVERGW